MNRVGEIGSMDLQQIAAGNAQASVQLSLDNGWQVSG
jgi:hypothetical protein